MAEEQPRIITRRDLLRTAGIAGAAAMAAPSSLISPAEASPAAEPSQAQTTRAREPFEHLTAAEADLVEAIAERLIPTDANGPGAKEARVVHYIDRALGGALASSRPAYAAGLAALEGYAQSSRGKPFLQLSPSDQDSVLGDCEKGAAEGFAGSAQFFTLVLNHARQGMFGDPYYGGNANFVGWDLIAYPGVRTMVTSADQKTLEANQLKPNHKSAYDYQTFTKATARAGSHGFSGGNAPEHGEMSAEVHHGD